MTKHETHITTPQFSHRGSFPPVGWRAKRADEWPVSDHISGSYIERSGSLGDSFSSLPNASQRFVRLLVDPDPQSHLVTMTFLGEDLQTVFSAMPCPPGGPISFSFCGSAYTDPMTFQVDPSPPPDDWD